MKRVSFVSLVLCTIALISSCSIFNGSPALKYSYQFQPGCVTSVYNAKVFQTLETKKIALAEYSNGSEHIIFAIKSNEVVLYDELTFSGEFVMMDTYTYETYPDELGHTRIKTVPLVVSKSEYLKIIDKVAASAEAEFM